MASGLINDTNAALLVTLHTQRSKIAPVSRRAAIREFRKIVHATGEEMAKIATTEKVFIDAKVDRLVVRKAQARGWYYYSPAEIQLFEDGGFGVLQSKIFKAIQNHQKPRPRLAKNMMLMNKMLLHSERIQS